MLDISQQENFAIGNIEAINSLSESDSAEILLVSDSHGSTQLLKNILYQYGRNKNALCFCGDGMPDVISILEESTYDPELLEVIPPVIYFVRGNGDNSSFPMITSNRYIIQVPVELEFTIARKKIFMTHGHNYNVYYGTKDLCRAAFQKNCDLAFYGHTHIANAQKKTSAGKKLTVMNPGSCSLPRGGMPHTFATVTINGTNIKYNYYELKWDSNGEVTFRDYTAPTKEMPLIW